MITYCNKDELKVTMGNPTWYQLKLYKSYEGLMFDKYYYRMDGNIFGADTEFAKEAFEKEQAWYLLSRTKRSNLEILADIGVVADEIERSRQKNR